MKIAVVSFPLSYPLSLSLSPPLSSCLTPSLSLSLNSIHFNSKGLYCHESLNNIAKASVQKLGHNNNLTNTNTTPRLIFFFFFISVSFSFSLTLSLSFLLNTIFPRPTFKPLQVANGQVSLGVWVGKRLCFEL